MGEITVSYTRTINIGNFESVKVQAGITTEYKEGHSEDFDDLYEKCESFVLQKCEDELGIG